jgi:hypothetical protein
MKILIDPMLAILARDLSTEDKAELLMCILEYPNRDCALGLWEYIKQQIDQDAKKYREKCDRIAASRQARGSMKSTLISDMNSDLFSSVKEEVSKDNIIKSNVIVKERVSSNALAAVENLVENFTITENFSINTICKANLKLQAELAIYLPAILERAEKTLIKKRFGQRLSSGQIVEWVEQERKFYEENHRSKA